MRAQLPPSSTLVLTTLLTVVPGKALAQVIPDNTLGAENSLIIPATSTEGSPLNRIEGGAIRGSNLFHSFLEFNIDAGQQLYFANPDGITTILSRVTGSSPSQMLGTLGVEGSADLFLLNPNGIVFGSEASLDIAGSFYATTAAAIPLGDGVFSAVEPEQSSLLVVSPNALFTTYLTPASGDIRNQGALAAEGALTLAANNLDLKGRLAAGGDLTLLAGSTVQVRDSAEAAFVALAGDDLLVQGNEQVDIVVLSHPDSGLYAYGDMTLRSVNAVSGDARYWSGGTFRVEALDGSIGSLHSPVDPIIRTIGDVFIESYQGSSLHILAGGAVTIGTAVIVAPDAGQVGIDFLQESIRLSNGALVQIDGGRQPTLDVRAGVSPEAIGSPPAEILTGFNSPPDFLVNASASSTPSGADITVGDVLINALDGLVLLTTQYEPNTDIPGGSIAVTGEGTYGNGIDARGFGSQGSAIFLDAREDITVTNSFIRITGSGEVGDIVLISGDTVRFDGLDGSSTGTFSSIAKGEIGTGGNVQVWAANLEVLNGAVLSASTLGEGPAGSVLLEVTDTARFEGFNPANGNPSGAFSRIEPGGKGSGGNLELRAANLEVLNGAQLSASTFGEGPAGSVLLEITDTARFEGFNPVNRSLSGAFSNVAPDGKGSGGNVEVRAANLEVLSGAQLGAGIFGEGAAGSVLLEITDTARFEGFSPTDGNPSGAFSRIEPGGKGSGGNLELRAANLEVLNGAQLNASTLGEGGAGSVLLEITDTARLEGFNSINGRPSGAFSRVERGGKGSGGNVELQATNLEVLNGARLDASTSGEGAAGSVLLEVTDRARFDGFNPIDGNSSGAFSSVAARGKGSGGNVELQATTLEVLNGAQLGAGTFGEGNSGSVLLEVTGTARFESFNPTNGRPSGAFSRVERGGKGSGGNVELQATTLEVLNGARLDAATFGKGAAGSVLLEITDTARFDSFNPVNGSSSGAFSSVASDGEGSGGNVELRAATLDVLNGAQLGAGTFGKGDSGSVLLEITDTARFVGFNPTNSNPSGAFSRVQPGGKGTGGNVELRSTTLEVLSGARLDAATFGEGAAGSVLLEITDTARFVGFNSTDGSAGGAFSSVAIGGKGSGGNVELQATTLEVLNGAQLGAGTFGEGDSGSVLLEVTGTARFVGFNPNNGRSSGAFSSVQPGGRGNGNDIRIQAERLDIGTKAQLFAGSLAQGDAGNVVLNIRDLIQLADGTIATNAEFDSGGQIQIQAGSILLLGDSDIQTFVRSGENSGGDITIGANFLIALDDSDILAFAVDGRGGNIDFTRTAFLGQDFQIAAPGTDPSGLDGNSRVDISATGGLVSGTIVLPDVSFIENSLNELAETAISPETLTAGSCIAQSEADGSFVVSGSDGLPNRPGEVALTPFATGSVQPFDEFTDQNSEVEHVPALQEPEGLYQLADGRLVLSRVCQD